MSDDLVLDGSGSWKHPDDPGEPSTTQPRLSVTDDEAAILATYANGLDVLEIGTGLGVSTRALAAAAATVTTVDVDEWVQNVIWPGLPDNVTGVSAVPDGEQLFDVVFIDADHSTAAVVADLAAARRVVKDSGVILAHDVNYDNVRNGLDDGPWEFIESTHGIGVCWVDD
jgi:cyclopropane fatty-acyl-phospholipid synthase-like methyltransferase